jgi:hypothetical protein
MTPEHFGAQMNRLSETFGKTAFNRERSQLIWVAVKDLTPDWFKSVVDNMIGTLRQAPLVPDFVEAARFERNRIYEEQKRSESRISFDQLVSNFTRDDERMMAQTIVKRLRGEVPDNEWDSFLKMLDGMAAAEKAASNVRLR